MKILHLMLSNYYIDGASYQENILPLYNLQDGHEVKIIASTETFVNKTKLGYVKPAVYINEDGIEVTRIPYRKMLPHFIMKKIRAYENLMILLEGFKPDVILHHGVPAYELSTLTRFKKRYPQVKVYLDSHESYENSARSFLSRELLHRQFYGRIVRKAIPYVDKVLCTSTDNYAFLNELYGVAFDKTEYYPLAGIVFPYEEILKRRKSIRQKFGLSDADILMIHSGKIDKLKRTEDLVTAFSQVKNEQFKLFIFGAISNNIKPVIMPLVDSDHRIRTLGWLEREEIINLLCAADIYLQPGSRSVTMQQALCCGCAVILYPHPGYEPYLKDNGYFVRSTEDIVNVFEDISNNQENLKSMKQASYMLAKDILDYKILAQRLYR